jgi:plastocyanin
MKEYVFLPAQLTFKVGVSYRLHFVNAGKELHEFTAPGFFKSVEAKNPGLLANGGQEVVLQPGATKDFDFVPRKAGYFAVTCADHDWAGMTGGITVE